MLAIKNVFVSYGKVLVLKGVELSVRTNEIVALMGANGSGKSTTLKAIFGVVKMSAGEVHLEGKKIIPHPEDMVGRGVSYVPQGRQIFNNLTVVENLEMGGYQIRDNKILRRRVDETFDTFPLLQDHRKRLGGVLSGGQQQILALAQGLMMRPKILLLDEPTLGLSPKMVETMLDYIQQIHKKFHTSILVVEHNIESLCEIVNRIYVLEQGRILADGTPAKLQQQKIWDKIFLGK